MLDIVLGLSAQWRGWLPVQPLERPVTGLNIYSMIVAVGGAIIVLFIGRVVTGRSRAVH